MVLVAQTFLLTVSFSDLTYYFTILPCCFFILVNVMNVYILCFDHSILIFQFLHALYASAPYLRLLFFLFFKLGGCALQKETPYSPESTVLDESVVGVCRHSTLLLHMLYAHLRPEEQREAVAGLEALTAKCQGTPQPLPTETGLILPPVHLTTLPTVRSPRQRPLRLSVCLSVSVSLSVSLSVCLSLSVSLSVCLSLF